MSLQAGDIVQVRVPEERVGWRGAKRVIKRHYSHKWDGHFWFKPKVIAILGEGAVIEGQISWGRKTHRTGIPVKYLRKVEP